MSTFIDGNLDPATALHLLTMQDAAYRGMADNWPKPRWCKFLADGSDIFVMVWLNKACAERFYAHCDPRKLLGHCDRSCWNDECSARYAKTDREAVARVGEIIESFEPIQGNGEVRVTKFAFRPDPNNNTLKGVFVYGECPDE